MIYDRAQRGTKIRIFTLLLIISVVSLIIIIYYQKVINKRDRLTAKRIEQSVSLVLARYVGANLTYDDGTIYWTKPNSDIIKNNIATVIGETVLPVPQEKGCYYYMYLKSPYTVIKLPYKIEGNPEINYEVVTDKYIKEQYPKKEYVQVNEVVPNVKTDYEVETEEPPKNQIVCLNT